MKAIIFTAFKACGGKDLFLKKNPFQYRNATILIASVILVHILQIVMLITNYISFPLKSINESTYLILIGLFIILSYLCTKIFSKKMLAKSISIYKDSSLAIYAKLIAFGYLFLNIAIVIVIAIF
jgi:hypothetical protein